MTGLRARWIVSLALAAIAAVQAASAQPGYEAAIESGLRAIYEHDDDAAARHFATLEQLRPEFPAYLAYRSLQLGWRVAEDPGNEDLVDRFIAANDAAIAALTAWTRRMPRDATGWRHLASAHGQRSQFFVSVKPSPWAAVMAGRRMHAAIERAAALDPSNVDTLVGVGAWDYFTSRVPRFAKPVAWMLGVGGGNRDRGLQRLAQVVSSGEHMRTEASLVLASAFWAERDYRSFDDTLRPVTTTFPRLLPVHTWRISGLICLGDQARALEVIDHAHAPDAWKAFQRGRVALAAGSKEAAERDFTAALAGPLNMSMQAWAHVGRGRAQASATAAKADLEAARRVSPGAVALAGRLFATLSGCDR